MTDIEKRKAAINKLKYKSLITTEDDDFDYIAFPKGGRDAFIEAFYDLLAPYPQAPDGEVDFDAAYEILKKLCKHGKLKMSIPVRETDEDIILYKALRAAQQPRQEWKTIDTIPDNECVLVYTKQWGVGEARQQDVGIFWANIDPSDYHAEQIYPTHWQPLPEPPKDKP